MAGPAQGGQPQSTSQMLMGFVPLIAMVVAFYFLLIRPQQKKAKEHAEMLKTVRPGDRVLTSSGLLGVVISVKDKSVTLRSADAKLEVTKSAVAEILERNGDSSTES